MIAPEFLDEAAAWAVIQTARDETRRSGAAARLCLELGSTLLEIEPDGGWSSRQRLAPPVQALLDLYLPLAMAGPDFVVAHLGQSLDGRIAAANGASRWITGPEDILHNHRMRALADAVIVGAETARRDNPQLTVRRCAGSNPVRAIIDPWLSLDPDAGILNDDAAPTLMFTTSRSMPDSGRLGSAEIIAVPEASDALSCEAMIAELARRGLRWIFIEGGGVTVSRFLDQGALDRLQVTISPMIIGSGRPALMLPEIQDLSQALRPRTRRFDLGQDLMIECLLK